LLRNFIW
jgi:ankyrin repeat protein